MSLGKQKEEINYLEDTKVILLLGRDHMSPCTYRLLLQRQDMQAFLMEAAPGTESTKPSGIFSNDQLIVCCHLLIVFTRHHIHSFTRRHFFWKAGRR